MIDPKIANIVSADIQKDSIIIFDECHNIDNVCIESLSMYINNRTLDQANQSIKKLENQLREENRENSDRLQESFVNLTQALAGQSVIKYEDELLAHPILR